MFTKFRCRLTWIFIIQKRNSNNISKSLLNIQFSCQMKQTALQKEESFGSLRQIHKSYNLKFNCMILCLSTLRELLSFFATDKKKKKNINKRWETRNPKNHQNWQKPWVTTSTMQNNIRKFPNKYKKRCIRWIERPVLFPYNFSLV